MKNLLNKIRCFLFGHESDLWLAGFFGEMTEHIIVESNKDWGWYKVPYEKFGMGYYLECKRCKRKL